MLKVDCWAGGWKIEVAEFIRCLKTGKPFRAGIDEGIRALRIALAGYQASKTGRKVRIPS